MAKVWEREGLKVTFLPSGKIGVEIDIAAITAATQLEPIGTVRVYEIDPEILAKNVAKEAGRAVRRVRDFVHRKRKP